MCREKKIAEIIRECEESAAQAKLKCKKPVKLSWDKLSYTVMVKDPASASKFKPKKIPLEIVKGVSGYALPG